MARFGLHAHSSLIWGRGSISVPFYFVQDCRIEMQKRDAKRSHSHYCRENQHQETKEYFITTNYFLGRKNITQQSEGANLKSHSTKTIAK